ncbi:hypothetical protein ACM9HF_01635 [Colwellia sp. RE-S-Sl-9]
MSVLKVILVLIVLFVTTACGGKDDKKATSINKVEQPKTENKVTKNFSVSLTHVEISTVANSTPVVVDTNNINSGTLTLDKEQ